MLGCSGQGTAIITYTLDTNYVTKSVSVYPMPSPIFGDDFVCIGYCSTVYDTSTAGWWYFDGTGPVSVNDFGNYAVLTVAGYGFSNVYFSNIYGCSTYINIMAVGPEFPSISGDTIVDVDSSITLWLHVGAGTWSSSDTAVASVGLSTGIVTGIASGTALISYHNPQGCITTKHIRVKNPLQIPIFSGKSNLEVALFPNPVNDILYIRSEDNIGEIAIYNMMQQLIATNKCKYWAPIFPIILMQKIQN